ncbi:FadR/GntR family transcriptional regulator [Conexibacter sp. CPCC 206217]|uniref:FadR/GntR family transcriptional regulator n=1 Tax=Conexibacter sp. CPCC 206217 TaxID=3064574 RepID=UPI00271CF292|nr:FadR/GntR family transcriptional regulator [Conexibacter sp. CPCC 206217]MDO8209608.1 FadR/GntR family transcriptional regulator [Conexibacter sp. CPCC 206217]
MSERIARANTYELVAERLLLEIAEHRLASGDFVATERELAERYGVGRSSVREGLRMLESVGVIRQGRATGQFVVGELSRALSRPLQLLLTLGMADLRELGAMRRLVECETARLAAVRRSPELLGRMHAALDEMRLGLGSSRERTMEADLEFHSVIAEASGNRAMEAVVTGLRDALSRSLQQTYLVADEALQQHRKILAAIEAQDPLGAHRAMAEHMDWIDSIIPHELAQTVA